MSYLAIRGPSPSSEPIERRQWNADDAREIGLFLAQCLGVAALAVVLYSVGPAVALLLVTGGLAIWSLRRGSARASDEPTA